MSDLKARIGKRVPNASYSPGQTGSLHTHSHAHHLEDVFSTNLQPESHVSARPKRLRVPVSPFSSHMDLGLDSLQLSGTVSATASGTRIPLIQRIQSREDTPCADVKIDDQGSKSALRAFPNVLVDEPRCGDVNTDGITGSSNQDKNSFCHKSSLLCAQSLSSHLVPPSASEALDKHFSPANDQRAVSASDIPLQVRMSIRPSSPEPRSTPHTEEQVMDKPGTPVTLASHLRDALHPVVMQNVQLRRESTADKILPEGVQDGAKGLLTDELCESFIAKMRSVQQEMEALKPNINGANEANNECVPRSAPEVIVSTSQTVTRSENGEMPATCLPTPPVSASLPDAAKVPKVTLSPENGRGTTSLAPPSVTRSISPPYFPSRKGKDRAYDGPYGGGHMERNEGHIPSTAASTSQSKVLPSQYTLPPSNGVHSSDSNGIPIPMHSNFFSTPSKDSPSPSRFSRPYPTSRSWHQSSSDRRPPSRSPSPHRQRYSPSPHRHRLSPTPDRRSSFRRRRTPSPHRLSPHPRRRSQSPYHRSPASSHPYTPRRGVSRSPDRSSSRRSELSPTRLNGSRRHAQHRSRSRSCSPPRSINQSLGFNSYSHPNGNLTSNSSKDHSVFPSSPLDTLYVQNQEHQIDTIQPTNIAQSSPKPCHNVPGLWFVKTGHSSASVAECKFEVDKETAVKWKLNENPLQPPRTSPDHSPTLCLQLLCLPADLVKSVHETSNLGTATPEEVAIACSNITTKWPVQGTLVVEVNPDRSHGKTWLPRHLTQTHPPLDVTGCICEGMNVVRLIQLTGLADKVFVLHAMLSSLEPSDAESDWDITDWVEGVQCGLLDMKPAVVQVT